MAEPNKKILIIYEFFYPAYKAGGVIQSLRNMIALLHNDVDFYYGCFVGFNKTNVLIDTT